MRAVTLVLLAVIAAPAGAAAQPAAARPNPVVGTFMAARIDAEAIPVTDRVIDDDGTEYVIEFDRLILSLRDDARFRASVRYRRTLFANDPRGRARGTPLQSLTVTGTYEIVGAEIRFTPDDSEETRGLRMLAGTVRGARELSLPFSYRNGTRSRDRTLVMRKQDDIL